MGVEPTEENIDNEAIHYLQPDEIGWSDTRFVSIALKDFQYGPALLTVIANGVPSVSKIVLMGDIQRSSCIPYISKDKILMICW